MTAKLTIALSPDVLDALKASKSITIRLQSSSGRGSTAPSDSYEPRAGSLPARLIQWAKSRKRPFGANDVSKHLKLTRAHASMLLSRLANGPFPIKRERRGIYCFES